MPDVIGFLRADAKVRLTNQFGIDASCIEFEEERDAKYNVLFDNQITRSFPAPGDPYNPGDTIILYVCTRDDSKNTAPMPDCKGLDAAYAQRLCEYALYKVKIVEYPTPDGDNTVISQNVGKGKINPRDTEVTLTVNTKLQGMPNFYMGSLMEAKKYLDNAGIPYLYLIYDGKVSEDMILGFTDYMDLLVRLESCGAKPGTKVDRDTMIIFQSIPMGGEVPEGSVLQLVCLNYEAG
jgi:beta-lactam-binding protein with PASTA domain